MQFILPHKISRCLIWHHFDVGGGESTTCKECNYSKQKPLRSRGKWQIWWLSVERFKSYRLCKFSRWWSPPSWILCKCYVWSICCEECYRRYFPVKYGDNRLNGSKLIALCSFTRWRPPPSWILSKCYIWLICQKIRYRRYKCCLIKR